MVGPKSNAETSEIVPNVRANVVPDVRADVVPDVWADVVPDVWADVVRRGKVAAGEVRWVNCEFRMPIPMGRGEESGGEGVVFLSSRMGS